MHLAGIRPKKNFFFFLTANFSTKTQKKAKQANNKHSQRQ